MDTCPDFSGTNVKAQIIENYDGMDIPLKGKAGMKLSPQEFPDLLSLKGKTLITTDGTTLLGADDKAGVSEIMAAMAYLVHHPEIEHGKIRIALTPDEETGTGIAQLNVKSFGADFAYTVEGGKEGELEFENFNASRAFVTTHGKSVHPGDAKGVLVNAMLIRWSLPPCCPSSSVLNSQRPGRLHFLIEDARKQRGTGPGVLHHPRSRPA
jgi:tripeptide aminopeptidase